jgi:hypothetical protein
MSATAKSGHQVWRALPLILREMDAADKQNLDRIADRFADRHVSPTKTLYHPEPALPGNAVW